MKLVSYRNEGVASYGVVVGDSVVDLRLLTNDSVPDLKTFIALNFPMNVSLTELEQHATLKYAELELLPVIPNPEKIVCVGLNYRDHVREVGREVDAQPTLFLRTPLSQVAHGADIMLPPESSQLDYEGEIAVIIGKPGRRIPETSAWEHVAGYACYNDGTIRDWQFGTTQWTPGKNFWRTGAFGPWMVTADEIEPGQTMTLVTRLNGKELQRATTDMLIHSIPRLISHISTFVPLEPGDVIVTGTPGGVGAKRKPPVFMKEGDVVEVEVDAIGVLRNGIRHEEK
jgi:2-keto-4-pentenoate hydratase/2-oxohepta-3-ene-1,7-dioic acid hydratase in catechol pathway